MTQVEEVARRVLRAAKEASNQEHSESYFFEHLETFVTLNEQDDQGVLKEAVEQAMKDHSWPWQPA